MVGTTVSYRCLPTAYRCTTLLSILILSMMTPPLDDAEAQVGGWTQKARMPFPAGSACVVNGKIYVLGGAGNGPKYTDLATNEAYDPVTDTWEVKQPLPTPRGFLATAVVNDTIYAIGGGYPVPTNVVEAYDPAANTWTTRAPMLQPRIGMAAAVVNGIIYIMGGNYSERDCEAYDPRTDTWTEKAPIPLGGGGWVHSATAYDGRIYLFGGSTYPPWTALRSVSVYDPAADTWTLKEDMPTARFTPQSYPVDGKIYVMGGSQSEGTALATVEVYDPLHDTWSSHRPMPEGVMEFGGATVNGKIYVLGGSSDWMTVRQEVWEYDPAFHTDIAAGDVSGVWTPAGSPYHIGGEITVPNGSTLTIQPGVEVVFTGHHKLNVQGRLLAAGTQKDSIWFTARDPRTGWHGIRFIDTPPTNDTSKLVYCSFRYGKANTGDPRGLDRCGGAIMVRRFDKLLVSQCLFEYNTTEGDIESTGGPGICVFYGSPVITKSTFRYNTGTSAGAIKIDYTSTALISGNIITDNSGGCGGVLCAYGSDNQPTISGNLIARNTATWGAGGILVWQSAPRIENNVIVDNRAPAGGGLYVSAGRPAIVNNTIALNSSAGGGGGLYCVSSAVPVLMNNILFGNRAPAGAQVYIEDRTCSLFVRGCDIQGGLAGFGGPGAEAPYAGVYERNIDLDPRFADTSSGDYRLTDHSGCIGSGVDSIEASGIWWRAPSTDQGGFARPQPGGSRPDIGAWEHVRGLPLSLLSIAPARHDFQNVRPGSVSDTMEVRIKNGGEMVHEIQSLSLAREEFRLVRMPTLPCPLPSLGEVPLRVVFCPVTAGAVVIDTLVIFTSDSLAARVAVPLRGRGSGAVQAARREVLYGLSCHSGLVQLHEIERGTGKGTYASTFSPPPPPGLSAVTVRSADSSLYAAFSSGGKTELYRLSSQWGDLEPFRTLPLGGVTSLAFDHGDRLFVATSPGKLYRVDPGPCDTVFLGTSGYAFTGLAFSPATGQLWASIHDTVCTVDTATGGVTRVGGSGIPVESSSLTFSALGVLYGLYDNTLVIIERMGGWGRTVGSTDVPGLRGIAMRCDVVSGSETHSGTPLRWTLEQNYPNPFNAATTIRYEVPEASEVRLAVYDLLGRELRALVQGRKEPGRHTAEFDASDLASGVYFYRMNAGGLSLVQKMVTVK